MKVVLVECNGVITRMIPVDKAIGDIIGMIRSTVDLGGRVLESDINSSEDIAFGHIKVREFNGDYVMYRFSTFEASDEDIKMCYESIKEEEK